jgi:hypothetical protein
MQSLAVRKKLAVTAPFCQLDYFQAGSLQRLQCFSLRRRVHAEKRKNRNSIAHLGKLPRKIHTEALRAAIYPANIQTFNELQDIDLSHDSARSPLVWLGRERDLQP